MPITRSLSSQTAVRKGDAPLLFQSAEQVLKVGNPYHGITGLFTSKDKASETPDKVLLEGSVLHGQSEEMKTSSL